MWTSLGAMILPTMTTDQTSQVRPQLQPPGFSASDWPAVAHRVSSLCGHSLVCPSVLHALIFPLSEAEGAGPSHADPSSPRHMLTIKHTAPKSQARGDLLVARENWQGPRQKWTECWSSRQSGLSLKRRRKLKKKKKSSPLSPRTVIPLAPWTLPHCCRQSPS